MTTEPEKVEIQLPFGKPQESLFADHYFISRNGEFFDFDFGCGRSGARLSVRMTVAALLERKTDFNAFLERAGADAPKVANWATKLYQIDKAVYADAVGLAKGVGLGEIAFHAISWNLVANPAPQETSESKSRGVFYVACVRMDWQMFLHWLVNLLSEL